MRVFDHAEYDGFTRMYVDILKQLLWNKQYSIAPRGLKINEIVNAAVIVPYNDCTIDFSETGAPERDEIYQRYKEAELQWYLSGNTLASSAPSKFWNQLADQDGHITSNYGHMMLFDEIYPSLQDQSWDPDYGYKRLDANHQVVEECTWQTPFERVVETLVKDPDSRQAIVHYGQPRHYWPSNKDQPCTLSGQFFLRDGQLSFTVHQRSCDVIKGLSYDVPWQCLFLEMVSRELNSRGLVVTPGEVTMVFGSLHLYEKDFELAKKIVSK